MKSLIQHTLPALFVLLLLQQTQAQPIFYATETNVDEITQEIFNLHGSQIDIDYNEVYNFIKRVAQDADPDACESPTPQLEDLSPGEVVLSWKAVSDANFYNSGFLSLSNGTNDIIQTHETEMTYYDLKGLVLFSTGTSCFNNIVSSASIIIVDVDIMRPTPPEGENCFCRSPKLEYSYSGWGYNFTNTTVNWTGTCTNSKYRLSVSGNISGIPYSSSITFLHGQGTSPNVIYLLPWCDQNAISSASGPVFAGSGGIYNASFTSTGVTIAMPVDSLLYVDQMSLELCSCKGGRSDELEALTEVQEFQISPNPGTGFVQLGFYLDNTSDLTIEAFDMLGKQMKSVYQQNQLASGQYQLDVDVHDWPSGMYSFRLSTEQQSQVLLFTKE